MKHCTETIHHGIMLVPPVSAQRVRMFISQVGSVGCLDDELFAECYLGDFVFDNDWRVSLCVKVRKNEVTNEISGAWVEAELYTPDDDHVDSATNESGLEGTYTLHFFDTDDIYKLNVFAGIDTIFHLPEAEITKWQRLIDAEELDYEKEDIPRYSSVRRWDIPESGNSGNTFIVCVCSGRDGDSLSIDAALLDNDGKEIPMGDTDDMLAGEYWFDVDWLIHRLTIVAEPGKEGEK